LENLEVKWPDDGLEPVSNCPICNSVQREVLYRDLVDKVFFCAPGKWVMYTCISCKSAYLDPRPNIETIGLAYREYFTHSDDSEQKQTFLEKVKQRLEQGDQCYRYGGQKSFLNFISVCAIQLYPKGRENMDAAMRHLPLVEKGQRLLDFGCGNGSFLKRARRVGWDVVGVDLDPKAAEVGLNNGLDVRIGGMEILDSSKEKFDVITLSHVIEYVHDPVQLLTNCYKLLKKNGILWIETPNILSTGHQCFRESWRGLEVPRHLALFNFDSLSNALNDVGFINTEVLPYRRLCKGIYNQSAAISAGLDPFSEHKAKASFGLVESSEELAKVDVATREFITLKASKA